MNITASEVVDAKLTAHVVVPAADVDAAIKKAYKDIAAKYPVEGFRKGRVPRQVIDAMFGKDAVRGQAVNDLLEKIEPSIFNELDIVITKQGDYKDITPLVDGADYEFDVEFKVAPVAELNSYEPVAIEMPPAEVTEAEIDSQVDQLLAYTTTYEDVEDGATVEAENAVHLAIENVANAEQFAGENVPLVLGTSSMPAEWADALIGMKKGESKEITWTLEGAEEASTVKIEVKDIRVKNVPELTDEFAKNSFGFESVEAMRDAIKLEVEADKANQLPGIKESRCVAELAKRLELEEIDEDFQTSVFQDLGQNFLTSLQARGMSLDSYLQAYGLTADQFMADLHHQAEDVARESIALNALAAYLNVEVTEEDVKAEFANANIENPEESYKEFVETGRIPAVRESIRRSKACDWLVENAVVTEVDEIARDRAEKAE